MQNGGQSKICQRLGVFIQRGDDVRLVCIEIEVVTVDVVGADYEILPPYFLMSLPQFSIFSRSSLRLAASTRFAVQ